MSDYIREKLNEAIDVEDFFDRELIKYKRSGSELLILCPFHDDSHPSCFVSTLKRVFHCFSCGAKGDIVFMLARIKRAPLRSFIADYAHKYEIAFPTKLSDIATKPADEEMELTDVVKSILLERRNKLIKKSFVLRRAYAAAEIFSDEGTEYYRNESYLDMYDYMLEELERR